MNATKTLLVARGLTKRYELGESIVMALNGVNLTVFPGDYLAIMGPSGSGKTTLLDILSGLARPTDGDVFIHQQPVSTMTDSQLAQLRGKTVGFVFQTFNLIPRLTAKENVMLPLWFQNIAPAEREKIAMQMLERVGLSDRVQHKPNQLSGGQRQRVAIARALAVNPDIIVADEPTGNLDSTSGDIIMQIIDELNQKYGKTILMVTHEPDIAKHAKKIIHLKDGQITAEEIVKKRRN